MVRVLLDHRNRPQTLSAPEGPYLLSVSMALISFLPESKVRYQKLLILYYNKYTKIVYISSNMQLDFTLSKMIKIIIIKR